MSEAQRECDGKDCANPAIVHLTQVVNDQSSTQYLCKACAEAKGITTEPAQEFDVSDFLAQLGDQEPSAVEQVESCSFCDLSFDDFKKTGRLGCPHCFTSFDTNLRRLLNRIHGATQHVGKVYLPPDPAAEDVDRRIDGLRRSLQRAIDTEDFERAAVLRDEIRVHEGDE